MKEKKRSREEELEDTTSIVLQIHKLSRTPMRF